MQEFTIINDQNEKNNTEKKEKIEVFRFKAIICSDHYTLN